MIDPVDALKIVASGLILAVGMALILGVLLIGAAWLQSFFDVWILYRHRNHQFKFSHPELCTFQRCWTDSLGKKEEIE